MKNGSIYTVAIVRLRDVTLNKGASELLAKMDKQQVRNQRKNRERNRQALFDSSSLAQ